MYSIARVWLLLLIAVAGCCAAADADAAKVDATPAQLIARLETVKERKLADGLGNPHVDVERLMVLRGAATAAVTAAIDRYEAEGRSEKRIAILYRILGFVKDPGSIAWLRQKIRQAGGQARLDAMYTAHWIQPKSTTEWGHFSFGRWAWLQGRERWIAYWSDLFALERDTALRVRALQVLAQFDDASAQRWFAAHRTGMTDPRETLVTEAYLAAHGTAPDDARVWPAVAALEEQPEQGYFLVKLAEDFHHVAFVPFLIHNIGRSVVARYPIGDQCEGPLARITYQDLRGRDAWQRWYAAHSGESREAWRKQAIDAFPASQKGEEVSDDPFNRAVAFWNEIEFMPWFEQRLEENCDRLSGVRQWVENTCTTVNRDRFRALSQRMCRDYGHVDDAACRMMDRCDDIARTYWKSWNDVVHNGNDRMGFVMGGDPADED